MRFFQSQPKKPADTLILMGSPKGLLTSVPEISIPPDLAQDVTNLLVNEFGQYQVRPGLYRVTDEVCGGGIKTIAYIPISGSYYILLVDEDYKLYKCSGSEPTIDPGTAIATLEGAATILPFNGYAVIMDGGYLKYFNGTAVKLAYDDGEGDTAAQHDTTCQTIAGAKAKTLYSGSNAMAGAKITTQVWTAGYTMDITQAQFWVKKTGTPTGTVYARVYSDDTGPDTLLGTSTGIDVASLTTQFAKRNFVFPAGTVSLSPSTDYHVVLYYAGGDVDNNITIAASSQSSGGDMQYNDGTWKTDATANALCRVKPGKPPKAKFGAVNSARLFLGGNADKPGVLLFSNLNTLFDWSTPDGGGFVTAVDDNANSFPVGAIVAHYGDLYVFGQQSQPYLSKLTGSSPENYALPLLWQKSYTDHNSLLSLPNDVWIASNDGLADLAGVSEYGDLRLSPYSRAVIDRFRDYWTTAAFMGFNPEDNQLLIKLASVTKTLVCNLNVQGGAWTYYDFKGITPTAFKDINGVMYVGASNGYLYRLNQSEYQDDDANQDGSDFDISYESGILEQPFGAAFLDNAYLNVSSEISGFTFEIYKDGSISAVYSQQWNNNARAMQRNVHVRANSFKVKMSGFSLTGRGSLHSLVFLRRRLTGRKNI